MLWQGQVAFDGEEFLHQAVGRCEEDRVAGFHQAVAQGAQGMGLAGAGQSEGQDVDAVFHKAALGQLVQLLPQRQGAVHRGFHGGRRQVQDAQLITGTHRWVTNELLDRRGNVHTRGSCRVHIKKALEAPETEVVHQGRNIHITVTQTGDVRMKEIPLYRHKAIQHRSPSAHRGRGGHDFKMMRGRGG